MDRIDVTDAVHQGRVLLKVVNPNVDVDVTYVNFAYKNIWMGLRLRLDLRPLVKLGPCERSNKWCQNETVTKLSNIKFQTHKRIFLGLG